MPDNGLFSLTGEVAVVVGGGGVLAGAMASGMAAAGADIAVLDVSLDNAEARAESIRKATGRRAIAIRADATSKSDLMKACDAVLEAFGHSDILLNAAGVNSGTPFFDISEEEWQRILDIDLKSVFLACQVFGKPMVEARHGSVINISSASSGPPLSKVFTYAVAKAGVNQITQFLAREWASYNVRVNAILPGFFPAEQNRKLLTTERTAQIMSHTPMMRFGEASELIGAAVYLASPKAASFVTGAILRVDGGFLSMTI
jgi:NAD(P)-dependent dehydrogenase (short-subunit alcohol dehydrogenase family)